MSKRHAREHGRILSVDEETLGSVLVADAASGATTLTVDDAAEFEDDGTGGWLSVNDQVIEYDTVDDDAGTIHLKTALTAAADDGDPVYVWSKLYGTAATVKTALVMVDGEDDNTDPIHATLSDAVQDLPEGLRGEAGEACTLVRVSDDEWEITAIGGRPSSTKGAKAIQFYEDSYIVTAPGDQSFPLTFEPIEHSEHLYWNTLYQPASEWARSGQTVTVPDPDDMLHVDDVLTVEYAYLVGLRGSTTLVPWQATGWSYLQVASGDTTDRSAPGFNDSSWAVAPAAFAKTTGQQHPYGYPGASTVWNVGTRLWLRRDVEVPSDATSVTVTVRVDDTADVYWNGTLVGSCTSVLNGQTLFTFDVPSWSTTNTLAVRGTDAPPSGGTSAPTNWTYLDASVAAGRI